MITCTRRLQFCAGHRVYGHENKCANMHGHNYCVLVKAHAPIINLDHLGRVVDFSVLKDRLGGWIDHNWDHAFIYYSGDLECKTLFQADERFVKQKTFMSDFNPTAEEIARYLLLRVCPDLFANTLIEITSVIVWETENCFAEATL